MADLRALQREVDRRRVEAEERGGWERISYWKAAEVKLLKEKLRRAEAA